MKTKLSLSLTFRQAALGLVSLLLTATSSLSWGFTDRQLQGNPAIAEALQLLNNAKDLAEVTQILESSELSHLYKPVANYSSTETFDTINIPLSTWRKLAQYYIYTGYQARMIESVRGERAFVPYTPVECILSPRRCKNIKPDEKVSLNWGYMFGLFNRKSISYHVLLQEARGFVNSQILMANANFCQLVEQGLTPTEFERFETALGFTNYLMPYTFDNQRPGAYGVVKAVNACKGVEYRQEYFIAGAFLRNFECGYQEHRVVCHDAGQR